MHQRLARALGDDLAALRAVKKRVGSEVAVMVDYNQALSLAQARHGFLLFDEFDTGLHWSVMPRMAIQASRALEKLVQAGY